MVCAVIKQVVKPSKDIEKKCSTRADANKGWGAGAVNLVRSSRIQGNTAEYEYKQQIIHRPFLLLIALRRFASSAGNCLATTSTESACVPTTP